MIITTTSYCETALAVNYPLPHAGIWKAIVDKIVTAKIDFDLDFRAID